MEGDPTEKKESPQKARPRNSPEKFQPYNKVKLPDGRIGIVESVNKEIVKVKVKVKRKSDDDFVIEQVETFNKNQLK